MRRQLLPAVAMVVVFTVLYGLVYPLVVTGIAQVAFRHEANGSFVEGEGGRRIGSSLIGQRFTEPRYFHPRPSAAGDEGYDAAASLGSNLGPTNPELLDEVAARAAAYREDNDLPEGAEVPVDAVTASGSGLDPHISVANARIQAPRVAEARGVAVREVRELVDEHTDRRDLDILGEEGVNVLELNQALDRLDRNVH
jgi:potassium-transporting ATPase KdpC subunit